MFHPLAYPAHIEEATPDCFVVSFPDIPEALTGADTRAEALALAADALAVAVDGLLEYARPVPPPSAPAMGDELVALDPQVAARVTLSRAMADQHVTKVALAKLMGKDEKVVRRILSGRGASFAQTLDALAALGVRPALAV